MAKEQYVFKINAMLLYVLQTFIEHKSKENTVTNMLQFSFSALKKHLGISNYVRVDSMWASDHI